MNQSIEESLRPLITPFLNHVETDPKSEAEEELWLKQALEYSVSLRHFTVCATLAYRLFKRAIHTALVPVYMVGFEVLGLQGPLNKVWHQLVKCKAHEEQNLEGLMSKANIVTVWSI